MRLDCFYFRFRRANERFARNLPKTKRSGDTLFIFFIREREVSFDKRGPWTIIVVEHHTSSDPTGQKWVKRTAATSSWTLQK